MDGGTAAGWAVALVSIIGHIITWRRNRGDLAEMAKEQVAAARRDTVSDRDALIDQLQEELTDLRKRVTSLEEALNTEKSWNRQLVDHIYRQLPPPPPPRPAAS